MIIAAHYDSHGVIDGNLYPGADSNASGVVAMLNLAVMFGKMKELGRDYGKNLILWPRTPRKGIPPGRRR